MIWQEKLFNMDEPIARGSNTVAVDLLITKICLIVETWPIIRTGYLARYMLY